MIRYDRMTEDNIEEVVSKYIEYYNEVEDGCWVHEKAFKRIHQVMTIEDSACYLQYDDEKLVGFLMGYYKEYDDLLGYYIEEIVIFKGFHNRGFGTAFLEKIQKDILERGATLVELLSVKDEHHMHFYKKEGFFEAANLTLMGKHFDA